MSRYRKIDARLWGDAKFCALSPQKPSGQSLWLYLISGPHNTSLPGLFVTGEASLAENLLWTIRQLRQCWAEIEASEMARADWKARVVWLPNATRYNAPANPNVVLGWGDLISAIPECNLKMDALAAIKESLPLDRSFQDAWYRAIQGNRSPNRLGNGLPNGSGNGLSRARVRATGTGAEAVSVATTREGEGKGESKSLRSLSSPSPKIELQKNAPDERLVFPIIGRDPPIWTLDSGQLAKWVSLYPNLDVVGECRKAIAWCHANPGKQRMSGKMKAFLVRWLDAETNRPCRKRREALSPKSSSIEERLAALGLTTPDAKS